MKNIFWILCLTGLLACKPGDDDLMTPDYFVFGSYYGECYGESCIEIFKIEHNSLFEDTNDVYPNYKQVYQGNFVLQSNTQYQKVKNLINSLPVKLLEEKSTVIGQPDAGDWGGIYIEVKQRGSLKYYLIDTKNENIPAYLHAFTAEVKASINQLQ